MPIPSELAGPSPFVERISDEAAVGLRNAAINKAATESPFLSTLAGTLQGAVGGGSLTALGNVTGAMGLRKASDALYAKGRQLQVDAAPYMAPQLDYTTVKDVGSAWDFAKANAAQGVGSMAPMIVGRKLGGAPLGLAAGAAPQLGETVSRIKDDSTLAGMSEAQILGAAAPTAALQTGLDYIVPGGVATNLARRGATALGTGVAGRAGATLGTNMLLEGGAELGQEELGMGMHSLLNPNRDTGGDEHARIQSFLGGAVGGAPMGAIDAGMGMLQDKVDAKPPKPLDISAESDGILKSRKPLHPNLTDTEMGEALTQRDAQESAQAEQLAQRVKAESQSPRAQKLADEFLAGDKSGPAAEAFVREVQRADKTEKWVDGARAAGVALREQLNKLSGGRLGNAQGLDTGIEYESVDESVIPSMGEGAPSAYVNAPSAKESEIIDNLMLEYRTSDVKKRAAAQAKAALEINDIAEPLNKWIELNFGADFNDGEVVVPPQMLKLSDKLDVFVQTLYNNKVRRGEPVPAPEMLAKVIVKINEMEAAPKYGVDAPQGDQEFDDSNAFESSQQNLDGQTSEIDPGELVTDKVTHWARTNNFGSTYSGPEGDKKATQAMSELQTRYPGAQVERVGVATAMLDELKNKRPEDRRKAENLILEQYSGVAPENMQRLLEADDDTRRNFLKKIDLEHEVLRTTAFDSNDSLEIPGEEFDLVTNNKWVAQVEFGDKDGKRVRKDTAADGVLYFQPTKQVRGKNAAPIPIRTSTLMKHARMAGEEAGSPAEMHDALLTGVSAVIDSYKRNPTQPKLDYGKTSGYEKDHVMLPQVGFRTAPGGPITWVESATELPKELALFKGSSVADVAASKAERRKAGDPARQNIDYAETTTEKAAALKKYAENLRTWGEKQMLLFRPAGLRMWLEEVVTPVRLREDIQKAIRSGKVGDVAKTAERKYTKKAIASAYNKAEEIDEIAESSEYQINMAYTQIRNQYEAEYGTPKKEASAARTELVTKLAKTFKTRKEAEEFAAKGSRARIEEGTGADGKDVFKVVYNEQERRGEPTKREPKGKAAISVEDAMGEKWDTPILSESEEFGDSNAPRTLREDLDEPDKKRKYRNFVGGDEVDPTTGKIDEYKTGDRRAMETKEDAVKAVLDKGVPAFVASLKKSVTGETDNGAIQRLNAAELVLQRILDKKAHARADAAMTALREMRTTMQLSADKKPSERRLGNAMAPGKPKFDTSLAPAPFREKEAAKADGADWVLAIEGVAGSYASKLAANAKKQGRLITSVDQVKAGDIIYMSVPGASRDFVFKGSVYRLVPELLEKGAIIRGDNDANAHRSHNAPGEGVLYNIMQKRGYEVNNGKLFAEWSMPEGGAVRDEKTEVVRLGFGETPPEGVISTHRKGYKNISNTTKADYGKADSGWLGNPYIANDVRGGVLTREQAVDKYRKVFLAKIEADPDFKNAVEGLRGKKLGYYKPSEHNHVSVVTEYLSGAEKKANAQSSAEIPVGDETLTDDQKAEIRAAVTKRLGEMELKLSKALFGTVGGKRVPLSADWAPGSIRIAANIGFTNGMQAAMHEGMHEFFDRLSKEPAAKPMLDKLLKAANSASVVRQLERLLADHPNAKMQIKEGQPDYQNERLAYMYQFWQAGALKLGPETKTIFQRIFDYLRDLTKLLSDDQQAELILQAFDDGKFSDATKTSVVAKVMMEDMNARRNMVDNAVALAQGPLGKARELVFTAHSILAESGVKEFKELANMFDVKQGERAHDSKQGMFEARKQMSSQFLNKLKNVLDKLEKKDAEAVLQALFREDGVAPKDMKQYDAYKALRAQLDELHDYFDAAGVKRLVESMGEGARKEWEKIPKRKHYFPVVWEMDGKEAEFAADLVKYHQREIMERLKELGYEDYKESAKHMEYAQAIAQRLTQAHGARDLSEIESSLGFSPLMTAINERTLDWITAPEMSAYRSQDLKETMTSYIMQAVKRAEYVRRFGNGAAVIKEKMLDGYTSMLAKKFEKLGVVEARKLAQKLTGTYSEIFVQDGVVKAKKDGKLKLEDWGVTQDQVDKATLETLKEIKPLQKAVMAMEGTLGHDISENLRSMSNAMIVYQNFRLLAMTLFSSMSDPLGIVVRGGDIDDAYQTMQRGFKEVWKRWKQDSGTDDATALAEMIGSVDAGMFAESLGQTYSSLYMSGKTKWLNDQLFKWNGMEAWNRGMRVGATQAAIKFIKKHMTKPDKNSERYLKELFPEGFRPELTDGELNYTDPLVQQAIMRWVDGAILSPNAAQRPMWASDPHYGLFFHMKQFAYSYHRTILMRAWDEAVVHGNAAPTLTLIVGYVPLVIAADAAKSIILSGGDEPYWMQKGVGSTLWHGMTRANLAGIPQIGLDGFGRTLDSKEGVIDATLEGVASVAGPTTGWAKDWYDKPLGEQFVKSLPLGSVVSQLGGQSGNPSKQTAEKPV